MNGAQSEESMQDSRLVGACLEEKRVPKARDKKPWQLDDGPALEPLEVFLVLGA